MFSEGCPCSHSLPKALIIGVKKSGTGSLMYFLDMHPDVAITTNNEIRFFLQPNYKQGYRWYRNRLPCACQNQITIEKTPIYFPSSDVPGRVREMNKTIRLILIVRDPVERTISDYGFSKWADENYRHRIWNTSFEDSVFLKGKEKLLDTEHPFIRRSVYSSDIRHWLEYFRKKQILVLYSKELLLTPWVTLHKVERFLGIKYYIKQNDFVFNNKRNFYCYKKKRKTRCMPESKGIPHINVSDAVKNVLYQYFKPFNEEFKNLTGVDLN